MIYLIPVLAVLAGCYIYDYRRRTDGKFLLWIILLITFICIAGFRYRMGGDTIQYNIYFEKLPTLNRLSAINFAENRYAPGFIALCSFCKTIVNDFMLVQFVVSLIVNSVVFYFFWKNTKNPFFALFLYSFLLYLALNMEVLREALAVSCFLLAWPFFRDGKWIYYLCCCAIALLFHISAIVLFLLPLICVPGIKFFFKFGVRTWFVCGFLLAFSFLISYFFFDFIKMIAITDNMMERADAYANNVWGGSHSLNISGFITKTIKYILYPALAMYFINESRKNKIENDSSLEKKEALAVTSIYISIVSVSILILQRYNNYLLFFPFLLISDWMFSTFKVGAKKVKMGFVSGMIIILPLIILSFTTFYFQPINKEGTIRTYMLYYPYTSGFDKALDPDREKLILYLRKRY